MFTVRPFLFEPSSPALTTASRSVLHYRIGSIKIGVSMSGTVLYGTWLKIGDGTSHYYRKLHRYGGKHRPRVYPDIRVQDGWEIMSLEYVPFSFAKFFGIILKFPRAASSYLLTDDVITEKGDPKPPPLVSCFFGPFKSQIYQNIKAFEVSPICLCTAYDSVLTD